MKTFEMDGEGYVTDEETLDVLRSVVTPFKAAGREDNSAVAAVMHTGLLTGRISRVINGEVYGVLPSRGKEWVERT